MQWKMNENSLFAILLRSSWWISFAIAGTVTRESGDVLACAPIPAFLLGMVEAGGLLAQLKTRLKSGLEKP